MFENKTKNMFLTRRGSNILEPRLQYNGAWAPIYWSPLITELQKKILTHQKRYIKSYWTSFVWWQNKLRHYCLIGKKNWWLQYIGARAPLYWSLGSNLLEPLRFNKHVFCFIFEHETRQTKCFQFISWAIMWYTKPGFIRALPPQSFPEFWK